MNDKPFYVPNRPPAPPCQPKPGELLFESHVERTHTFWRVELRDHGEYGVEAKFFDPVDLRLAHTLPTREVAVAWAGKEQKAIEADVARADYDSHPDLPWKTFACKEPTALGVLLKTPPPPAGDKAIRKAVPGKRRTQTAKPRWYKWT
jgi:hypothetical protein